MGAGFSAVTQMTSDICSQWDSSEVLKHYPDIITARALIASRNSNISSPQVVASVAVGFSL